MVPVKVSTLVLDTRDLSSTDINSNRSSFQFRNIDFDILLNEDWRQYDMFNMALIATVFGTVEDKDEDYAAPPLLTPEIRLTGVPVIESDVRVNASSNEIAVCTVDLSDITSRANIVQYPAGTVWTLKREDENLFTFRFRLVDPETNGTLTSDGPYPHQQYIFKLYHLT